MTSVFFVRHAQPDENWADDRTRPLTALGMSDRARVGEVLGNYKIDVFYSSPYKRSADTISRCADSMGMAVHTDERFREREQGVMSGDFREERWNDFSFREENGESLSVTQKRNIEALSEILSKHPNKNIVIGTHGTALSTILNYYDASFGYDDFLKIWRLMPYIIRLDFEGAELVKTTELLKIDRGY